MDSGSVGVHIASRRQCLRTARGSKRGKVQRHGRAQTWSTLQLRCLGLLTTTMSSLPAALDWPAQFCILVTVLTYVASIITSNVSQVDRLWTFLPTIYTAYYALLPLWPNIQPSLFIPYTPTSLGRNVSKDFSQRALLMLTLVTLWMCRLSYNTWRRGLFSLYVIHFPFSISSDSAPGKTKTTAG